MHHLSKIFVFCLASFILFLSGVYAQETNSSSTVPSKTKTTFEYLNAVREAAIKTDSQAVDSLIQEMLQNYDAQALAEQKGLTAFPERSQIDQYQILNDVATALFVQAELLMNTGKTEEAVKKFQNIIDNYSWAQAWDPRGWYWSVKEKSQASIDVLTGKVSLEPAFHPIPRSYPKLTTKGTKKIVDFTAYGQFLGVGTDQYRYVVKDSDGLSKAIGEGIYPNLTDFYKNPKYDELKAQGFFDKDDHWNYVNIPDLEKAYFKWYKAKEPWGVKLFYLGTIFEKSGMYYEALKAYHSLVVNFPKTVAWTYWQTPWYPAQAAIAKIKYILRVHPELNLEAKWMKIEVINGFDNDASNDIFIVYPGKIVRKGFLSNVKSLMTEGKCELKNIKQKIGKGTVRLVQYDNGHWQMLVNDKPYIIKGITYAPTKIGQSPDKGTLKNWMYEDSNGNGIIDGPYEAWVDKNLNDQQDPDEPTVGDFQLMKEMGVNTIRVYNQPNQKMNKELLRDLYKTYGIRVVLGDFLGKYAIGSGATWTEGTDYENPEHRKNMLAEVKAFVMEHKDEPYVLLWLLGNENNYGVASNADKKPEAYFKFVNEVAKWIKSVDRNHPVAINNGDALFLDIFAKNCPNVDIFAANIYRGDYGFGSFWEQVHQATGKPGLITEYGAPSFAPFLTKEEGEQTQADYHKGNWLDIEANSAGHCDDGVGNALGGIAFEWLDEWWKNYEPYMHDTKSDAIGPFAGGYYYEEWFGIIGQGKGKHSPFLRQLKKSYATYKELWNKK